MQLIFALRKRGITDAAVLSAPMEIRGYGSVKEAAAEKVQAEVAARLG